MKTSAGIDYVEAIAKLDECKARSTQLYTAIENKANGISFSPAPGVTPASGSASDSDVPNAYARYNSRRAITAADDVESKELKATNCFNALIKQVTDDLNNGDPKFVTHNYEYLADTHALPMFMSDLIKYIVRRKPRIV